MAWSFVAAGTVATGTNPTVTLPTGWAQGNLLVLVAVNNGSAFTTPSGWTVGVLNGTNTNLSVWYKFAGSSESSVAVSTSNSTTTAVMLAYSGVSSVDVAGTVNSGSSSGLSTNTITTTNPNDLVISVFSIRSAPSEAITAGSGYTSRVNYAGSGSFASLLIGDENYASSGSTASRTASASFSTLWATFAISFIQTPNNGDFFLMF